MIAAGEGRPSGVAPPARLPSPRPMHSRIDVSFARTGPRTFLETLRETGALRLRLPRGTGCVATLVNTGGGLVAGDRVEVMLSARPGADVTVTSVAAEKVYRASGPAAASVATRLVAMDGAAVAWLPQETILFDGARLDRRLTVELSRTSRFLGAEMLTFGRLAAGERSMAGALRDGWRVNLDGRPVFADEAALDGAIGASLDRPAVAGRARAVGLLVRVGPDNAERLDGLRAALAARAGTVEGGASLVGEVLVGRLLALSPAELRSAMIDALRSLDAAPTERMWT